MKKFTISKATNEERKLKLKLHDNVIVGITRQFKTI